MTEDVGYEVANQLESLTAQSPAVQDTSNASASQNSLFDEPEEADKRIPTSNESDLTDIDDLALQDVTDSFFVTQSGLAEIPFVNPIAPRVSYQVSASGEVMIIEDTKTPKPNAPAPVPRPSPPSAFLSFDRLAHGLPPKAASSPTTTLTPPSLAVECIVGPKQPIPAQILELLEEWHEESPYIEHPSALTGRAPSTWKNFQTFSDDGDECELSLFQISVKGQARRTITYRIVILHAQNGPEELVVYGQPRPNFRGLLTKGTKGLYLLDWIELERKGEVQACGLKLWRTDEKKISFSASMFDDARKCTRLPGPNDIFNTRLPNSTPKKHTDANEDYEDAGSISSEAPFSPSRSRRQASTNSFATAENRNKERAATASRPSWYKTISPVPTFDSRDELRSLESPWKPQKRRRSTWSSNEEASAPMCYKLLSDASDQVRVFKTDDAKVLFEKAREFYKGMDKRSGLLFTVSGVEGV
ncbi:hypothetical protein Pdw03_5878 [Penicillium digitatum]|uniref:Uncharacterized protein n=3 Tax=Penicillium digitatum TaxID=36651 RepID=K9GD22_PEND2|nr:hypothetical protein PDIP_09680 [Penicillium digitatum Pd1]EKV19004.1 hypothetical protein PDIG_05010 [Penicillium digitatum PHI26]EKV21142.1 hypothetical protein PDIP_09680 [Penicillium digitatum Pd1]KAG0154022.1 hypothetical protein PDIDSM_1401 [Penicillium digitatum]QQK48243.1 hypothetical protein Pdw03_5878 [Penicillium digitatum]